MWRPIINLLLRTHANFLPPPGQEVADDNQAVNEDYGAQNKAEANKDDGANDVDKPILLCWRSR